MNCGIFAVVMGIILSIMSYFLITAKNATLSIIGLGLVISGLYC